ncbi:MAG: RAD55 family ATPase [Candidatus Hodarchaeales archaeon]|jgi:KaiC/GvpD/RAD55 family RecA-like ATPase
MESGIPGLDDLFHNDFPSSKTLLLSGPPGAGKTVFCMQFLVAGAISDSEEPAVYVAFDDRPAHIRNDMQTFGWDIETLENSDPPLLSIVDGFSGRVGLTTKERYSIRPNVDSLLITLRDILMETGSTRIVIDSLTTISSVVKNAEQVRKEILTMSSILGDQGCTTILTAELGGAASGALNLASRYGVEEYSAQGSIILSYYETPTGEYDRAILIQKMRGHRHVFGWRKFAITEDGLTVYPDQHVERY